MYETKFAINDLVRRRGQTGLALVCLTLSVASTLFLLLFSSRLGLGLASGGVGIFTRGISAIFAQFMLFLTILIFSVGAVLMSFMVVLMMTQRTQDLGLIKAVGCPNDLLFGYYMTELLYVSVASCSLGVFLGLAVDYAFARWNLFASYPNPPLLWLAPVVFVAFFILALVFGTRPILKAVQLSPLNALSPVQYYGLSVQKKMKSFTKSMLTTRIALRSLVRRKTATVRVVLLLSTVFVLLTVSIGGSVIANETTISWIDNATGQQVIAIVHQNMASQYKQLDSAFIGTEVTEEFDYANPALAVAQDIVQKLRELEGVVKVDLRLVLMENILEIANYTIDPDTLATTPVGDHRQGYALVVGVEPGEVTGEWFTQGRFLQNNDEYCAVIGDSIAQAMFSKPLVQSVKIIGDQYAIVGVCVDPTNNGNIIFVPLKDLQNTSKITAVNLVFAEIDPSAERATLMNKINAILTKQDSSLIAFDIAPEVQQNIRFLNSTWSIIMMLPLFTLLSASLCLMAFIMLVIDEQRQEFGFLRAMGAKPKTVTTIVAIQSIVVLLSSCGVGLSLGTISTLLILMRQPLVTGLTIVEIAAWLFAASLGMFLLSLLPAVRFARTRILKTIS